MTTTHDNGQRMTTANNGFASDDDIRRLVLKRLADGEQQGDLAKKLGIAEPTLSLFISRRRPHVPVAMLKRLGYGVARYYRAR